MRRCAHLFLGSKGVLPLNSSATWPMLTCVQQLGPQHPDPHCSAASHDRAHHHRQDTRRHGHHQVIKSLHGRAHFSAALRANINRIPLQMSGLNLFCFVPLLPLWSDHLSRVSRRWCWVPCGAWRSRDTISSWKRFNCAVRNESVALLKRTEEPGTIALLSKRRQMNWQAPSTMISPTGPGRYHCILKLVLFAHYNITK